MIPKVLVCKTVDIEYYLDEDTKSVISILDPGEEPPKYLQDRPEIPRIELHFGDTDPYGATEDYPCASIDDIQKILYAGRKFVKEHKGEANATILIHCRMGNSRSTAIALALWALWYPTANMAMAELVSRYPDAQPNRWITAVADNLLDYGDRLYVSLDEYYATGIVVTTEAKIIRGTNAHIAF